MSIRPHGLQLERIMSNLKDQDDYDLMPISSAGAPVDGTTGAGVAGVGCVCHDRTNGELYVNSGTKASPVWVVVGSSY